MPTDSPMNFIAVNTPRCDDPARVAALHSYGILDSPDESAYDDITKLAAQICDAPISVINLIDKDRQWFKSEVGMGGVRTFPFDVSICRHALTDDDLLIIPDLSRDERFAEMPIIAGPPQLRYYAGATLRTAEGHVLGALCVLDYTPRQLTNAQLDALQALAKQVMSQMELRKVAAKYEQQSREFEAVLSNVRDVIYIFDREGRFKYANRTLLDLFGMSREELQSKTLPELGYSPETIDYLLSQINEVYATKRRTTGEVSYVTPTGAQGVYEHLFAPLLAEDGSVQAVVGSTRDVAGHKAAQQQLRENADRLSLALSAAHLGDWDWDAATDIMKLSPRAAEIYGVPIDPPMTRSAMREQFVHEDSRERSKVESDRAAASHGEYDIEYRVNRRDGTQVWVAAKGRGVYDANGKLTRMLGVVQDITARKTLEQERERLLIKVASERARLTDAFMRSPAFMCLLSGPEHVFEFANEQYFKLIGRQDIMNRPIRDALPDISGQGYFELLDRVYETGESHVGKNARVVIAPGGGGPFEYRYVDFVYQPVTDADGSVSGIFVHGIDVTEPLRHEQEREQLLASERNARSEAERASRMKDEFLATLSHELRTPLNAIYGWSQILRTGTCDADEMASGLETIERNARAQTQIIEDLLDMSRIISGKIRLEVHRLDLANVVQGAIETVRPAADAKGIRMQAVLDSTAGTVMGDGSRLQQVFWNLLSNAIKFTPKGGRVTVVLQRVHSHLEVSVSDTGEGIRPEFLPHVFERFRQSDASTTRRHGGLGLGLAIVKQLVELHGGSVRAHSDGLGRGTTFSVQLPPTVLKSEPEPVNLDSRQQDEASAVTIDTAECAARIAGLRVLVVDDEPDARGLVKRLLEECDATVLTAASAAEALQRVVDDRPDILISDIGMPGEDGFSLIRSIRTLGAERGGAVPALALTAYARSEDRVRVMMAGFQMHIPKPVEPAELIASIASLAPRRG